MTKLPRSFLHTFCLALLIISTHNLKTARSAEIIVAQANLTPQKAAELEEIERRLVKREKEEAKLKNEANQKAKEVASLRERMIETANALQEAEQKIDATATEIKRLELKEKSLKASLDAQQENLGDVLAALQSIERSRPPAILVTPNNASKAARTALLLSDAAPELEARAATLRKSLDDLRQVRATLNDERVAFEKTNDEINDRRRFLADLLQEKQHERDVAARLARAAQTETAALAARATSLRGVLTRLEKFAQAITPRLKPPAPSRTTPTENAIPASIPKKKRRSLPRILPKRPFKSARGKLPSPVIGTLIGRFGQPRPEGGKFDGLRYSVADKAIVTAPYEGNIVFARAWGPVGNLIVLDVADGYHILMMGVTGFLVEEGQSVQAGEPVGTMTGSDAKLELEIRKDGEPVNPSLWLSAKTSADKTN